MATPAAATLKVALLPSATVWLTGCVVIEGPTVRLTELLDTVIPFPSVTSALNWRPLNAAVVATVVNVDVLNPVPAPNPFQVVPEKYCQA